MKLILAQPGTVRFQWELEVLLTNIRQFTDMEVVLLFTEHNFIVPIHFRNKWGCDIFVSTDKRDDSTYIPSVRPWLLWQYFRANPEAEQETYLYIDSDIIFREWLDFATLPFEANKVYGADCSSYISADYILKCTKGDVILTKMAEICGITIDQMKNVPGIGAQIILNKPTALFWERAYYDSNKIYHYLEGVDSNIQKWTAEMWAQLWGWVRDGKTLVATAELKHCTPTDDIAKWDEVKILHNAGVTVEKSFEYFFKGQYVDTMPFGKDFSHVRTDKATIHYVQAVQNVVL